MERAFEKNTIRIGDPILTVARLTLALAIFVLPSFARQRSISVTVLNVHFNPARPVERVLVELSYRDTLGPVSDTREVTNREGKCELIVSEGVENRGDLRITVTGATGLVIYRPAEGMLTGVPDTLVVTLVPMGSPELLEPAQIEAMLGDLLQRQQNLSSQIRSSERALSAAEREKLMAEQQKQELEQRLNQLATAKGFSPDEFAERLHVWTEEVLNNPRRSTEQEALARFNLGDYVAAANLFKNAAESNSLTSQSMEDNEETLRTHNLEILRNEMRDLEQSASTFQRGLDYHKATLVVQEAVEYAAKSHQKNPDDTARRSIWLMARQSEARALLEEGVVSPANLSMALLGQSIAQSKKLLQDYVLPQDNEYWAATQNDLGVALVKQAERSHGAEATDLLKQAVEAYRDALKVTTQQDVPQQWAATQNNLGSALATQAEQSEGAAATDLLKQALDALRNALKVYTQQDLPQEWAMMQSNLGQMLVEQGRESQGAAATDLLKQAVDAFREAFKVRTQQDEPQQWARTQNDLGVALVEQAERSHGATATDLLAQAVDAHREALKVFTQKQLPQQWAATQNNLGTALSTQAEQSEGATATDLLKQAVDAHREALKVYTQQDLPQPWAETENHLGVALDRQAVALDHQAHGSNGAVTDLLKQAIDAFREALKVRTQQDLPQPWAETQNNLGSALDDQAAVLDQAHGSKGAVTDLLKQAVDAFREALKVYTEKNQPLQWAATQNNLGNALYHQAHGGEGAAATDLLEQSVDAYREALKVRTQQDLPQDWGETQYNLGDALRRQKNFVGAAQAYEEAGEFLRNAAMLERAVAVYHDNLFDFGKAFSLSEKVLLLDPSSDNRLEFAENNLTMAHFAECVTQSALASDAQADSEVQMVREVLQLACEWGAGRNDAARKSALEISRSDVRMQKQAWNTTGDVHFLSEHPAFATARESWIKLFESLCTGNGAELANAAGHLAEAMRN
jgi:tetratricopeptide (TPR) repeat protein